MGEMAHLLALCYEGMNAFFAALFQCVGAGHCAISDSLRVPFSQLIQLNATAKCPLVAHSLPLSLCPSTCGSQQALIPLTSGRSSIILSSELPSFGLVMTRRAALAVPPVRFCPVVRPRPPLLLFLLALLLFLSFTINAFFCAQFLFGTFHCPPGHCATFAHANSHRQTRQIGRRNDDVLAKMEYAMDKLPNSAEVSAEGAPEGGDVPLFLPLYTQLSQKHLSQICRERFGKQFQFMGTVEDSSADAEENRTKQRKATMREKGRRRKKHREKVCPPIQSFDAPFLVARRTHRRGAAMRRGDRWFLTEYDTGYVLFQFDLANNGKNVTARAEKRRRFGADDRGAQLDFPSQIHTLPEPFRGTDHSVGGADGEETFFYQLASEDHRIQALHLRTGKRLSRLIYAAKYPLYGSASASAASPPGTSAADHPLFAHRQSATGRWPSLLPSFSSMDLEIDQSALWVLFRRPNLSDSSGRPLSHLTVLKLTADSLKELAQWDLEQTRADQMANAFVACGQLYGVVQAKEEQTTEKGSNQSLQIAPLFDFQRGRTITGTALPISAPGWISTGPNSIANVQYDAVSDSLTVFDDGNVFTSKIQRRKTAGPMQ